MDCKAEKHTGSDREAGNRHPDESVGMLRKTGPNLAAVWTPALCIYNDRVLLILLFDLFLLYQDKQS